MDKREALSQMEANWRAGKQLIESAIQQAADSHQLPARTESNTLGGLSQSIKRVLRLFPQFCGGIDPADVWIWKVDQWPSGICDWQLECLCKSIIEHPQSWADGVPTVSDESGWFSETRLALETESVDWIVLKSNAIQERYDLTERQIRLWANDSRNPSIENAEGKGYYRLDPSAERLILIKKSDIN